MTKEGDRDVARAYVALAETRLEDDDVDSGVAYEKELAEKEKEKIKERARTGVGECLEEVAVDRYMDDDEWEARERIAGRGVSIPRFPLFDPRPASSSSSGSGKWPMAGWMWNVKA